MTHDDSNMTPANGIPMPAPTSAPFVCAFGVTLLFAGIVTIWSVSIVGFVIALVGAIRWWREVLPDNLHELIPIQQERYVIEPRPGTIEHLMKAGSTHRARIPVEIHPYGAGMIGGIGGGMAMAIVAIAYGLITHGSPWYAINILSATIMPSLANADVATLAQWNMWGLIFGIAIHASMSLMIGLLYSVILPIVPRGRPLFAIVIVPLLWSGLAWASLEVVNPQLKSEINWLWFIGSQIAFGAVCGFIVSKSERIGTMQNWSMLERAGMDSPGVPGIEGDED
jgi:hypothetical protein